MTKPPEDRVGYKQPPKKDQFKPGQSGNPKGRPRKRALIGDVLADEAFKRHRVTIDGKTSWLTALEIMAKSLCNKAMKGDQKAVSLFLELTRMSTIMNELERGHPVIRRQQAEKDMEDLIKQMSRKGGLKL